MGRRARRNLDRTLGQYPRGLTVPARGWIRAIRDAIGLSGSELALRMGVTPSAVSQLEKSEQTESIRLDTLRRAADALECELVYAIVPRAGLEERVRDQALVKARAALAATAHSMSLEDQAARDDDTSEALEELADDLIDAPGLWSPPEQ